MGQKKEIMIKLCIGSSCHLRGSGKISEAIQTYLSMNEEALANIGKVEFCYDFCMGDCSNGVCMTMEKSGEEQKFRHVTPEIICDVLDEYFGFI